MNLKQRLLNKSKENVINRFKNKHPEVYNWFQSDCFANAMIECGYIEINWTYNEDPSKGEVPVESLPSYDSNGEVSIHEVCSYLFAEGFTREIHYNVGGRGFKILEIKLH